LIRNDRLEQKLGSPPLSQPSAVQCEISDTEDGIILRASHNGYVERFGLFHSRMLDLSPLGDRLLGKDRLTAPASAIRGAQPLPYAVHFHLHPDVVARLDADALGVDLHLPDGSKWRFEAMGAVVGIEESVFVAHSAGARLSEQIVLRGLCEGGTEVDWTLEKVEASPQRRPPPLPAEPETHDP
jgi:uncharacterized heparinase superfamily protein